MTSPRVFDKMLVWGERLTILEVHDDTVATTDDAGMRIVRRIDRLSWDEATSCWFDSTTPVVAPTYLRCGTCGVLLDGVAQDCGFCGGAVA